MLPPSSYSASDSPIDFSVCENEPIHQPGLIQSHGFLWAVPTYGNTIAFISENLQQFLESPAADFLNRPLADLESALGWATSPFPEILPQGPMVWSGEIMWKDQRVSLYAHSHEGYRIYEVELPLLHQIPSNGAGVLRDLQTVILPDDRNLFEAARRVTNAVAQASGYNRVMIYRFHPDWSGEVIAEWRESILVPYLGLRYPATDIPSQARELYKKNLLRTIANVTSISSAVLSKQPGVHLDLTYSILRSVSPYHLEYLQNMGVAATLTASLIVNGKLWGLIACHHTTPYLPSTMQRSAIGELAQRLGHWLEEREKEEQLLLEKARTTDAALLLHLLASTPAEQIWRRLFFGRERLASLLHADACALVAGQEVVAVGPCPSVEWLRVLAKSVLKEQGTHPAVFWEEIPDLTPLLPEQSWPSSTCGMAARVLLRSPQPVVIFAFRSELMHEIYWGGDPSRPVEIDERQRLSPRRSFELWRETIRGKSKPWSYQDRLRLEELGRMLSDLLSVPGNLDHLESSLASLANQDDFLSSEGLQLADSAAQGMALLAGGQIDKQDVVLSANARFCETFALDSLHIQGFTVDKMLEGLSATLLEDDSERSVWEIWSPQQGHRVLSLQRKNFVTYEGRAGHLHLELFDFLDITNDRRLREAMRVARDQAIHSAEIKSAVLANMSHELRTPLSAILSYSEIMAEEFFGPLEVPQYKKAAQDIHAAGKHLLDLVNNLLDLAKLEGGNTVLRRQKINMVELVEQCAEWILPLSSKSEIKVDTIIQGENFFYYADPVRLKQVLINLLTNAVKFTPPGGNITVLLEERPHMGLVMEVQDSGVGIPADKIRYIFDRFYQVDLSDVRRVQGAGLGLSIARAIVELHGGRIEVESQEGRGTRMRVNLPNLAMAKIDAQGHLIHKSS